ncbi:MAG: hypothetical protein ACRD0W_02195, partial [Acidimicrobiales bacterium]
MAGVVHVDLRYDRAKAAVSRGAGRGLRRAAEHVADVSDDRTPVDTGELIGSRRVEVDERALEAAIGYGLVGKARAYAVIQHEDLTLRHTNGQAKFLESALTSEARRVG